MKRTSILGLILMGLMLAIRPAAAEVLTLAPAKAAVLPSQGDGWTRVALEFDLSGMPEGIGRIIDWAYVEWSIEGTSDGEKEFWAYPIEAAWTATQAAFRAEAVTCGEIEAANWSLTEDEQATLGCLLRLYLKDLVAEWAAGVSANYGLVIATREISGADLSDQLANPRLVISYAFQTD